MARPCTICAHPRVDEIHAALDGGGSLNKTAAAFGVPASNLKRHAAAHRDRPAPAQEAPPSAPTVTEAPRPVAPPAEPVAPQPAPEEPRPAPHPIEDLGGHVGEASGRPCEVCRSPIREQLERAILGEASMLAASKLPGAPSRVSLARHRDNCLADILARHRDKVVERTIATARERLEGLLTKLDGLFHRMEAAWGEGQPVPTGAPLRDYLSVAREIRPTLELIARITGELRPDVSVNVVLASPEWKRVVDALALALAPWPMALDAAAEVLDALDSGARPMPELGA